MIEPRDEELSRIYRDAEVLEPPQRVDDNILAASRRVAGAKPRSARSGFARRWGALFALAATMVVTFTVTLIVLERRPYLDTIISAARNEDRPSKSPAATPKPAARAPATPASQAAARRDRADERPSESAAALRKEETRTSSSGRAGADQQAASPDAQRAAEASRQTPPVRTPAAALPADASTLRESASTLQRAGVLGAAADRAAASEAKERPPEKWLEDIRKLKTQGKTVEAEREFAEFRKRYPDFRLPEDMR